MLVVPSSPIYFPGVTLAQKQEYYDKLLLTAKKDLEAQKEQVVQAQGELANLRARLEDKGREAAGLAEQLRTERAQGGADEARRRAEQRADALKAELENMQARLEEEKQRSMGLICQVH